MKNLEIVDDYHILTRNSQNLRKNMTREEKHLWYDFLKQLPITVNRQGKIGKYIVDFYIASHKIVIELDGSQHYEPENKERDRIRDEELANFGMKVMRYTNHEINSNFDGVCTDILQTISKQVGDNPSSDGCTADFPTSGSLKSC